jgi:putative ABC transport system permease protein
VSFFDIFFMALRAILRNKVRSVLTALGIVIGVASVIAMVHLGQAATASVTAQISSMGTNLLTVRTGQTRSASGARVQSAAFDMSDVHAISNQIPGLIAAPQAMTNATVVFGNANYSTSVTGTTNEFFQIRNWQLEDGRAFETRELLSGAPVCILGKTILTYLYPTQNPIGTTMRVGKISCQVIGVLASKGESMGQDQDDVVIMPVKAVQRRMLGRSDFSMIYISALEDGTTGRIKSDIEGLLRQRRKVKDGEEDDFSVRDMQELAQTLEKTTGTLTALLGAIAAVSLLVGGIGIMNIMLVSVTERTREIGIRLAIGALARDVLVQFLVESIAISTMGGLLGLALGISSTYLLTSNMNLPFILSPDVILVSFSFSAFIGVVFGYVPARKAARLNPIESLRHE